MKTAHIIIIIPSVIFLTLHLACNPTQMSELSCYKTSDPNITDVDRLYFEDEDDGNLCDETCAARLCSSTPPPSASECVVCSQQVVYAVCSNLPEKKTLVMEGDGRRIYIKKKSECPNFLDEGSPNTTTPPNATTPPNTTTPPNATTPSPSTNLNYLWLLLLFIPIAVAVYYREEILQIINYIRTAELKPVPSDDTEDVAEDGL